MLSFLFLLHIIRICICQLQHTTTINANTRSLNGASIHHNPENTNTFGSSYNVSVKIQDAYDIAISLDTKWSFNPITPTTLLVTLNGSTPNPTTDSDFIILFTVDNQQYFSFFVHLDTSIIRSHIYPTNKLAIKQDILSWLSDTQTYPQRWDRVSNGDKWTSTTPRYNAQAVWPLQFKIENDILSNTCVFSYYDQAITYKTGNTFNDSFLANKAMNIYIMGDTSKEKYHLYDVNLQLYYSNSIPTVTPTSNPTLNPIILPTLNPTTHPSQIPSKTPSISPSQNPTGIFSPNPSKYPTQFPFEYPTQFTTTYPTQNISEYPTYNPSIYPTQIPTKFPTHNPSVYPTQNPSDFPTQIPSITPSNIPSKIPIISPTNNPISKTINPTTITTFNPSYNTPTNAPIFTPTISPSAVPTLSPNTATPTLYPTMNPTATDIPSHITLSPITATPTLTPTITPTKIPTISPSIYPSISPTNIPSISPTHLSISPTHIPTIEPTMHPTYYPTNEFIIRTTDDILLNEINISNTQTNITIQKSVGFDETLYIIIIIIAISMAVGAVIILFVVAMRNQNKSADKNKKPMEEIAIAAERNYLRRHEKLYTLSSPAFALNSYKRTTMNPEEIGDHVIRELTVDEMGLNYPENDKDLHKKEGTESDEETTDSINNNHQKIGFIYQSEMDGIYEETETKLTDLDIPLTDEDTKYDTDDGFVDRTMPNPFKQMSESQSRSSLKKFSPKKKNCMKKFEVNEYQSINMQPKKSNKNKNNMIPINSRYYDEFVNNNNNTNESSSDDDEYQDRMQTYEYVENLQVLHEHDMAINMTNNNVDNIQNVITYIDNTKKINDNKLKNRLSLKALAPNSTRHNAE